MGIFSSKNKFISAPYLPPSANNNNGQPVIFEDEALTKLRRQLHSDAETFLLNNLLLTVQFFENYEQEIQELRQSNISQTEPLINSRLNEHQKHCLMPDTLYNLIDSKVQFQTVHGPSKYHSENLHHQRMLIAYDNIEVLNPSETCEYSSVLDGPVYRCVIESSKLLGYVRLKLIEIEVKRKVADSSQPLTPKIIRTFSFVENKETDTMEKKISENVNSVAKELTKEELKEDVVQPIYEAVQDHYTLKPLKNVSFQTCDTATLPNGCISTIEVKVFEETDEMEALTKQRFQNIEEYREATKKLRKKPALFKTIAYLNSYEFVSQFGDIFASQVAEILGFNQKTVNISMQQGAIIYTNVMEEGHVTSYEIIPCVTASWPDEAYEWVLRRRPTVQDSRSKIAYRWPTAGMIERVKSLPCHIIPVGFVPKQGRNLEFEFQWRLGFPAPQKFLETCLTHSQMRCYLFLLVLFKTYIENDTKLGLTPDHLRTFIFWEVERDYVRWPEERLGEKLKLLLLKLRMYLEYQSLPDYFLPQRNLFENIPTSRLLIAHRRIADILENPVIYLLKALRNLKFRHAYPVFDYKQLYELLETDNSLRGNVEEVVAEEEVLDDDTDSEEDDIQTRWYREAYRLIQEEKREKQEKIKEKRRLSTDSIKTNIKIGHNLETITNILILKMFIKHFIDVAKKSDIFDSLGQGLMYLRHAEHLTMLLNEEESGKEDAADFVERIRKVDKQLKTSLAKEARPKIPIRNAELYQPRSYRTTKLVKPKIVNGNYVNLNKENEFIDTNNYITKLAVREGQEDSSNRKNESCTDDDLSRPSMTSLNSITVVAGDSRNPKKYNRNESCTDDDLSRPSMTSLNAITITADIHNLQTKKILVLDSDITEATDL